MPAAVATADLHKAIARVWAASTLNAQFQALRPTTDQNPVLCDGEAAPGQSLPYCVMEQEKGETVARMSGHSVLENHEYRDIPWEFRIYARSVDGDSRSSKQIAADLAAEVLKVFGGHPTVPPTGVITLDSGEHVRTQYQHDTASRIGDDEWMWTIRYEFEVDVPVAL